MVTTCERYHHDDGGTYVAQWLQSRKSDPKTVVDSIDLLAGQGEWQFFYPSESTLAQTCLCLCAQHARTHIGGAHVRYPISIWRKRVGLTAGDMKNIKKTLRTGKTQEELNSDALWLARFPQEKISPNFPCIALGQDSYLMVPNNVRIA